MMFARVSHGQIECLKWLALMTMLIDHAGKLLDVGSFIVQMSFLGRLSFPLFALVLAYRLVRDPEVTERYLKRLFVWGLISQPICFWVFGPSMPLNIFFTFFVSVALFHISYRWVTGRDQGSLFFYLVRVCLCLSAAQFCDYGIVGVLIAPICVFWGQRLGAGLLYLVGGLGMLANPMKEASYAILASGALLTGPIAHFILSRDWFAPRLSKWIFYGFYPAHLCVLKILILSGL